MLLWKCWRDLRIAFLFGLGWLALEGVGVLEHVLRHPPGQSAIQSSPDQTLSLVTAFVGLQIFVFALLAFGMGTDGIGRDIGAGSGSFLLTRPIPRGYFVWSEWFSGLTSIVVLLLLSLLGLWLSIRLHAIQISSFKRVGDTTTWYNWTLPAIPFGSLAIEFLCAFLFLGLVFGITHLGTIAFRRSTAGLLFGLGFFVAWLIVTEILRHNYPWMASHIPDLLLRPFGSDTEHMRMIPRVTASILERLAILPLFPLVAQLFLRRTEV